MRGIVATDALIGTFADLDGPSLAQNICFLYHLIGGGTGDWDVPVGGMGAVTDGLARAAVAAGAELVTGAEVVAVDPGGEVTWRAQGQGQGLRSAQGATVLSGVAPTLLNELLATAGAAPVDTEPAPEGAQLKVNMLLSRLPRLRDERVDPRAAFAGTFHINETFSQLQDTYAAAAAGAVPDLVPCEIYCHSLSDRSILGPELAAGDAQTLTLFGLHLPARLFRGDNEARREEALAATLRSLNSVLAEPVEDVLLRGAGRAPVPGGAHPGGPRAGPRPARRQHLPPLAAVAVGRDPAAGRHVGGGDRPRAGAGVRGRRPARGRRQRHTRSQRGAGGPGRGPGAPWCPPSGG